jgi:hypothetical protein
MIAFLPNGMTNLPSLEVYSNRNATVLMLTSLYIQVINVANNQLSSSSLPHQWSAIATDKSRLVAGTLHIPRSTSFQTTEGDMEVVGESEAGDIKVTILGNPELLLSIG